MKTYSIPMVPGPVVVPLKILEAYQTNYGSADLESDFIDLYNKAEAHLQQIMGTRNKVAIQSGEGMLALWATQKCLSSLKVFRLGHMGAQADMELAKRALDVIEEVVRSL